MSRQPYETINMKALRCFETMAKHGSLTRASIELGVSAAAVSQRVRSLEKYLGAKLYEARGGKVRLTDAGQRTYEFAQRIFGELADFEESISDEERRSTLVVGAESVITRYHLPDIVEAYSKENSYSKLRLLSRRSTEVIELTRRNEVDLGIIHERSVPPDLTFLPWRTFNSFALIPHGHPLARGKVPTLEEIFTKATLLKYSLVLQEPDSTESNRLRDALESQGLPYNVGIEVSNIETVKHYVARGHGLAVVAGSCLTPEDDRIFHMIKIPKRFGDVTYGVIIRHDKHMSRPLHTLLTLFGIQE